MTNVILMMVDFSQAYRLEPLVLKHYATIMPLPIHLHSASHHSSYVGMPRKAYAPFQGSADGIAQKTCTEDGQDSSGKEECLENFVTAGTSHKTEAKSDGKVKGFSFGKHPYLHFCPCMWSNMIFTSSGGYMYLISWGKRCIYRCVYIGAL